MLNLDKQIIQLWQIAAIRDRNGSIGVFSIYHKYSAQIEIANRKICLMETRQFEKKTSRRSQKKVLCSHKVVFHAIPKMHILKKSIYRSHDMFICRNWLPRMYQEPQEVPFHRIKNQKLSRSFWSFFIHSSVKLRTIARNLSLVATCHVQLCS